MQKKLDGVDVVVVVEKGNSASSDIAEVVRVFVMVGITPGEFCAPTIPERSS